jgi:hypothetical protein
MEAKLTGKLEYLEGLIKNSGCTGDVVNDLSTIKSSWKSLTLVTK